MKFRIVNPPRKRARKARKARRASAKQIAWRKRFAAMYGRGKRKAARLVRKARAARKAFRSTNPHTTMKRRSHRRRYRRSRRSNPIAIANPRRRRSHRRRYSNPQRGFRALGGLSGLDILKDALAVGVGYVGASSVKSLVLKLVPVTGVAEQATGVGSKILTGVLAVWIGRRFGMPRYGRDAAVGAFLNASFDVLAIVTGKPLSLGEYVAPRTMALTGGRNRLRLGAYPAALRPLPTGRIGAGAFSRSLPKAF